MVIRRQEIQVFFTAFVFFFLETSLFHLLQYTHSHLESTLVISYALLGLSIGALAAYLFKNTHTLNFPLLILCFVAAILLAFINITRFPGFVRLSPLLIFPFLVGNVIITYFFRSENSNRIYTLDLTGATCGIFFSVIFIPLLKTENALLLCITVMCVVGFLFSGQGKNSRVFKTIFYSSVHSLSVDSCRKPAVGFPRIGENNHGRRQGAGQGLFLVCQKRTALPVQPGQPGHPGIGFFIQVRA